MNVFDGILEEDEKIINTWKPNERRFVVFPTIKYALKGLPYPLLVVVCFIVAYFVFNIGNSGYFSNPHPAFYLALYIVLPIVFLIWIIAVGYKYYQLNAEYDHCNYAITNKNILLSYGFKGYGFSKLALDHIQFTKLVCQYYDRSINTYAGTISFRSPSSNFTFYMINDVNNAYREIQEIINDAKKKKH